MSDVKPLTAEEEREIRDRSYTASNLIDRLLATIDAERAARAEAERERDELHNQREDLRLRLDHERRDRQDTERERDEYKSELDNACDRLGADDHIRREQQAEILRLQAEILELRSR